MGMVRKLGAFAVLLTLAAALVQQGLTLHVHVAEEVGQHLHSQTQDCGEAGARFDAECLTCRGSSKLRTHCLASTAPEPAPESAGLLGHTSPEAERHVPRWLRSTSPPRAPPV